MRAEQYLAPETLAQLGPFELRAPAPLDQPIVAKLRGLADSFRTAQAAAELAANEFKESENLLVALVRGRALADLLGGVLGGLVLGWLFDWLAGTLPWGLLGGLALGIVVAFRNIIRSASKRPDR